MYPFTHQDNRLLRCEMILSEREQAVSKNPADVRLELGDHAIAQELRELGITRATGCQFTPHVQAVLSPVLESLPV